jgi:nucleoid-associated protein YgaU
LRALRQAADASGLDPVAELYNEALRYASEGHLRMARERLHVLLGLNPDDGEARVLLARVHVAGQRWQEALAALDEARSCGMTLEPGLRENVEEHVRAEQDASEAHREALRAREQGEVKALRSEARRLRTENAQLVGRVYETEREMRRWAWTTAAVSAVTIVFISANLLLGPSAPEAAAPASVASVEATAPSAGAPPVGAPAAGAAAVVTPAAADPAAPVGNAAVADRAAAALSEAPGLDGTTLQVRVRQGSAIVSGDVLVASQKTIAVNALQAVSGISTVDARGIAVLARTKGTEHVVESGDNLSVIARKYYGDASLSGKIQKANAATLGGGNALKIGMKLVIPAVE